MASSIAWPVLIYISFSSWDIVTRASIAIGLMIPFAVACDFLFIVLTRVILAQAAQSNSFLKIATLAIGNAFLACVLVVVPIAGGRWLKGFHLYYARELVFLGLSNVLDALVSLTWFLIAIMMLLHRLFWPLIERPVYALFRHRVFSEQKKLVFFSGVALLGLAVPSVGRILETLVKAVHS